MKDWIGLINAAAWPVVALVALFYIWKSDAIAKLLQISDAVKDLRAKLAELVEVEQRLGDRSASVSEMVSVLKKASGDFAEIKADVENIRDLVEEENEPTISAAVGRSEGKSSAAAVSTTSSAEERLKAEERFKNVELAWSELLLSLSKVFGDFDKRSVAGEVYRYAHGNRKGPKLSYETADEIARLHSSIKSFRRRKSTIENWLDEETSTKFIVACAAASDDMAKDAAG